MRKMLFLLLFTSNILLAQRNVALLHVAANPLSMADAADIESSVIPFELAGGLIIVQAKVDGKEGNFILDTGAPGIVLNAVNSDGINLRKGASVSGSMNIGEVSVKNFQLGIIQQEKTQGHVLNVHHLEVACGRDIMGLIGFDVLKNFELMFDFPNKKIYTFKSGMVGEVNGVKPKFSIPFVMHGHVPVILAKVGKKRVLLGLDSGAEVNLLDKKFLNKIDEQLLANLHAESLTGLDNATQDVIAADVLDTKLKGSALPTMRYVFTDLSHLRRNFNAPLDGLLGVPFFKNKVIAIDYKHRRLLVWE